MPHQLAIDHMLTVPIRQQHASELRLTLALLLEQAQATAHTWPPVDRIGIRARGMVVVVRWAMGEER